MTELIGVALLIFAIVVAAIAYLVVHYFRFRWTLDGLRQDLARLEAENQQLSEENGWLRKAAGMDKN